MHLISIVFVVAIVNLLLSVPAPEKPASPDPAPGSYALDIVIFLACLAGIVAARRKREDED